MNSIPASSAICASRTLSRQPPDQRSGTNVTARPDEQLAPKRPSFSRFSVRIEVRSRVVTSRTGMAAFLLHGHDCRPARVPVNHAKTAIALISMRASGEVIFVTSTMVEAGAGGEKYSRRTLWMTGKCSMLRI